MTAPVFLAEPGRLDGVAAGGLFLLDGTEGRHAGVVQRREPGERVDVVDGTGVRLLGVVESVGPEGVRLQVVERVAEPAPAVALVLVQALAKGDRDELAIEAATEVGVDAVVPWQAERSVVVWRGERSARSRARWLATVRAATKQARRARVPDVAHAEDTRALAERVRRTVAAGGAALLLDARGEHALAEVALPTTQPGAASRDLLVVVGPEGGISDAEVERLVAAGAVTVRVGPHVMRTSTAGPVAVALLAQRLGRWM